MEFYPSKINFPPLPYPAKLRAFYLDLATVQHEIILWVRLAPPASIHTYPAHCIFYQAVWMFLLQHLACPFLQHSSPACTTQLSKRMSVIQPGSGTHICPKVLKLLRRECRNPRATAGGDIPYHTLWGERAPVALQAQKSRHSNSLKPIKRPIERIPVQPKPKQVTYMADQQQNVRWTWFKSPYPTDFAW